MEQEPLAPESQIAVPEEKEPSPEFMFCTNCGASKAVAQPEPSAEPCKVICPGCGKQVDPKAFCSFCGTKLS